MNVPSGPSATAETVTLRSAIEADREFLLAVYGSARAEELDQVIWPEGQREAFLRMQFEAQDTQYRAQNPDASFDVIEVGGRPAGRLYVDRRPGEIRIVDIALLEEFRGQGVGGSLLSAVLDEGAATGRAVTIHVEVHNPAASLYERLGFVPVAERGVYRLMEWRAP